MLLLPVRLGRSTCILSSSPSAALIASAHSLSLPLSSLRVFLAMLLLLLRVLSLSMLPSSSSFFFLLLLPRLPFMSLQHYYCPPPPLFSHSITNAVLLFMLLLLRVQSSSSSFSYSPPRHCIPPLSLSLSIYMHICIHDDDLPLLVPYNLYLLCT